MSKKKYTGPPAPTGERPTENHFISEEGKTVHRLFEEQVEKSPDRIAVVVGNTDTQITYGELNRNANRLAHLLRAKGVTPGTIVALMVGPSIWMTTALLGILKAGGAYLPIAPDTPGRRVLSMLEESGVSILLTERKHLDNHFFSNLQKRVSTVVEPTVTAPRKRITRMDDLPMMDRSVIDFDKYNRYIGQAGLKHTLPLESSRGCPYNCYYCHKIFPGKHVRRSAENLFEEVLFYYRLGIRRFSVIDDIFNLDIKSSGRFFRLVIENGLDIHLYFVGGLRGDILTEDYIDLMVEAGTKIMSPALETASPRLQKLIGKHLDLEKFRRNVEYICKKHPYVVTELFTMHGFPTETEAEVRQTMDFIKSMKWIDFPYLNILRIYSATRMAKVAMDNGISYESIIRSESLAWHKLPETLPFPPEVTLRTQAEFLNEYLLDKDRLRDVLPHQMRIMSEDELVQKYDSYLPGDIDSFEGLLQMGGIKRDELGTAAFLPTDGMAAAGLTAKLKKMAPKEVPDPGALRVLLLDLNLYFSHEIEMLYDLVDEPTGLMRLMTQLKHTYAGRVRGRIAKSRIDFDSFGELRALLDEFKPQIVGIRTLTFFKDLFHKTLSLIRQWGIDVPVIAGGPHVTTNYRAVLQDGNVDLAVLGEGELTLTELIGKVLDNGGELPPEETLKQIPGIAFIPAKEKVRRKMAREIVMLDAAGAPGTTGGVLSREPDHNPEHTNRPGDTAYVIFTSGSTGRPRGVMVEHRNLTAYLAAFEREFCLTPRDTVLQQAAYVFDTFAEEFYPPLLKGGKSAVAAREEVMDARRLTDFIIRHRVNIIDCSPLLLNELSKYLPAAVSPSSPDYTFISGGDVLKRSYIKGLLKLGTVYNTYGPTETTVCATYYRCPARPLKAPGPEVPIGTPISYYRVSILDKNGNPVPTGTVGELCISGPGVTRGYLNNPEVTAERFRREAAGNNRTYKTGDLGRRLPDGVIAFVGRIDFQVKIRGYRIELGEIEAVLASHPDIEEAVVTAREADSGEMKYLAAYIVPAQNAPDTSKLKEFLAGSLPGYMIPSFFTTLEQLPLTDSGKLDRKALPEPDRGAGETAAGYHAPGDGIGETLVKMWRDVLNIDSVGIHDNFFQLGGHSLKAMVLTSKVHKEFDVELRVTDLFENPTIKGLAGVISGKGKQLFIPMETAEEKEYYPPSPMQKRFYILNRMEGIGIAYNIPDMKMLEGKIDLRRVKQACRELILRHESLRTSFHLIDGELVQRVHRPGEVHCPVDYFQVNGGGREHEKTIRSILGRLIQPFDLTRPPLFRAALVKLEAEKYLFAYDLHHIAGDGLSGFILEEELIRLLEGRDLPPITLQYRDFSQWQHRMLESGKLQKQEKYWRDQFKGEIPVPALPTDYPPPPIQSFEGDQIDFHLKNPLKDRLYRSVRETGTTLYMLLLAAFNVLLYRYTGQEDIVVGSPVAGRNHHGLEGTVGLFINVLPLRNFPTGGQSFGRFLRQVKEKTLSAFENQDYPYGELVESLGIKKDLSRNPLFSVELVVHNMEIAGADARMKDPGFSRYGYNMNIAQLDISLLVVEEAETINCSVVYCTRLFKRKTMERAARRFIHLLEYLATHLDTRLSDIPFLTEEEKKHILIGFNRTTVPLTWDLPVHRLFEAQAGKTPDNIAVVNGKHISYKELNERAHRLAGILRDKGVRPDHIVAILTQPSIEMFIGLLGILKAGGAYLPLDPDSPEERIRYILEDSGARVVLSEKSKKSEWIELSTILTPPTPPTHPTTPTHPTQLCYVIYTSGSTGRPKGVLVEHRQLTNYLTAFLHEFTITSRDIVVQQSAYYFDAFAEEVYPILINGGKIAVPDKRQVADNRYLTDFIVSRQVNIIDCSPLLLNELNKRLPLEASRLSLPAYTFISGGDVLKSEYIHRLLHLGTVHNTYGPTETTVCATYHRCTFPPDPLDSRVPIGKPISNYQVYILDKDDNPVPPRVVGELHIAGPGVVRGYLNQPELTAHRFCRKAAGINNIYKTGDLAKWTLDGTIAFMGRIDSQVSIRGYRIEPGEIEAQLNTHPGIEHSVVLACENESGEKNLCAYVLPGSHRPIPPIQLRDYLSNRLPVYMVPAYFISILQLPLTPTGKVDRKALPKYEHMIVESEHEAPRNELERKLADMWGILLEIDNKNIGRDTNFFHLGGHSLKATQLATELYKELNVKISMVDIFSYPTIRDLARCIEDTGETQFISIKPTEKKEYYPLSPAQIRMYIGRQLETETPGYNVSDVIVIEGKVKKQTIETIARQLIARHESFRTSFHMIDREPVQKIHELVDFTVEYFDLSPVVDGTTFPASFISLFIRPFDLSRAPLIRMGLSKMANEKHLLIMDMHHIVSDGLSLQIFIREFTALYSRKALTPLRLQYKDYSQWINKRLEEREVEIVKQEEYWLKQFRGKIPVLSLPQDNPRPAIKNFQGRRIRFTLEEMIPFHLHARAAEEGSTLYILLLALFNIFLAKISGNTDIIIGTPVAGRRHPDLQPIIGMFVNTLAMRNYPSGEKTIRRFLEEVKTRSLEAFENQDYQFEELVNKLEVERDASRNPLFDVMFTLRTQEKKDIDIPHPEIQELPASYDYSTRAALFDITLLAIEDEKGLSFTMEYGTSLFKKETIKRYIDFFKRIVLSVLANPKLKLSQIEIISPGEKRKLLYEVNNTYTNYPKHKTIHELFEEQAGKTPDKIAIVGSDAGSFISYDSLNKRSHGLARRLRVKGLVPGDIAAVLAVRSIEVITGILAILKCGAAYLPIAPHYPVGRQRYILRDVQAALLLTPFPGGIPGGPEAVLTGKEAEDEENMGETGFKSSRPGSESPAYIIYTSGSTGVPKGVMVRHHSAARLVKETGFFHFNGDGRILQTAALEFDASIFEIWGTLLNGMIFFLTTREQVSWPEMLKRLLKRHKITSMWLTAPLFNQLIDADIDIFNGLGDLLVGGDALSPLHINRLREAYPGLTIINGYGPTENTTFSTTFRVCREYSRNIPIGTPISNSTGYILDADNNPLPAGIPGELCVGGDGVALGYVNRPELTAEKFINNPFVPGDILYRTGDRARWTPGGNIEFLGRVDSQVKIRGHRIELSEIEHCLSGHPGIKEAAVFVRRKRDGERYICAYFVPEGSGDTAPLTTAGLVNFLTSNLPDFMIPSYFVKMEKFPLTTIGKVDKSKLPEPDFGELVERYTAPADEVEMQIVKIWAEILGIDTAVIGVQTNFFHLGGHSLKATLLITRLHRRFNVRMPFAELFRLQTVRKLADYIKKKQYAKYEPVEPAESKEYYPLTPEQAHIYEQHQAPGPDTTIYNIPWQGEPDGTIETDIKKLEDIFLKLIERHENFRTSFHLVGDTPVQKIHKRVDFNIRRYPFSPQSNGDILRQFVRPFDLSRPPLLRVGLMKKADGRYMLMMDMHHIVSDGTSLGILLKELRALSKGEILPPLRTRYKDYAQWRAGKKRKETLKHQRDYWLNQFKDEIPALDLPTDYPRPPVKNITADVLLFELDEEVTGALKKRAGKENCTLFMLTLAFFYLLLFKLTGRRDIVVSTYIAERGHPDVQQIVGMFAKTLPLRSFPSPDKRFKDFLGEVRRNTLTAFENQEYPFDSLVEKFAKERNGRHTLADVNFVLQNFEMEEAEMEGLLSAAGVFKKRTSFYDLRFEGIEKGGKLFFDVEYDCKLFKRATAEGFIKQYKEIAHRVLEDPGKRLSEYL